MLTLRREHVVELVLVQQVQAVLQRQPAAAHQASAGRHKAAGATDDSLLKVVPVHDVLGDVLDGVLEVEPVSVAEELRARLAILEPDLVHSVPEGGWRVRRESVEAVA